MANVIASVRAQMRTLAEDLLGTQDERTPAEHRAAGAALQERVPLEGHAAWEPPADRPDPVDLLREQGATRVQELLPLRYERMAASPFAFYRGGALIMASDLSGTPTTGIRVQACGDAHIANFGLFASAEQRTVFDINDFDETAPGPWEWDVKRLAASVEICGRDLEYTGKQRKRAIRACVRGYREAMAEFAKMGNLDVWYAHLDVDTLMERYADQLSEEKLRKAKKVLTKAKGKNSARAVMKLTEVKDGALRIVSAPPTIVPVREMVREGSNGSKLLQSIGIERIARAAMGQYRRSLTLDKQQIISQYRGVDLALKVVGVGSVGTRALILVMEGAGPDDPLVLQVKEAGESVLERFCGKSVFPKHGQRVVEGQRAMQTTGDILLGWCSWPDENGRMQDFYVRQLWNGKGSFDLTDIKPKHLAYLAEACGWTLAHAHARTGNRFEIAGYLGVSDEFDSALVEFARAYADQNERDYARFMSALEAGEL